MMLFLVAFYFCTFFNFLDAFHTIFLCLLCIKKFMCAELSYIFNKKISSPTFMVVLEIEFAKIITLVRNHMVRCFGIFQLNC